MANTPINFNNPNINLPQKGNVASLVNKDTLSNLKNSVDVKAFGDQVKDQAKQQVIKAATDSPLAKLYKEKADLVQEGIQLDIDHQKTLADIEKKHTPGKQIQNGQTVEIPAEYNNQEYQNALAIESGGTLTNGNTIKGAYPTAQENLKTRKEANQKAIDDIIKDPFKKQKDELKKLKDKTKKIKAKVSEEERKAAKAKTKAVLQNGAKTLVPILTLLLTNKIASIIAQNDKIGKLVNDTNNIITAANESGDPNSLQNAQVARDTAIKVIQSNEDKINQINDQIQSISNIINIFNIIIEVVSAIPLPTAVPPGVGIPVNLVLKFVKILDKANRILLALSALLPIIITVLDKAVSILEDYKSQLLNINGHLDNAAANGLDNAFSLLKGPNGFGGNGNGFGTVSETYKGFRFALREEEGPNSKQVRQFKRHYAVAIDSSNIEVLKSDYSFTLDPDDLISQLKLIIDKQKLTTGDGLSSPNGNSNSANSVNPSKTSNSPNQNNSNSNSQVSVTGVPSSNVISSLKQAAKKPPPPLKIIAPAGGTTANIPLGVVEKAQIVAAAAASGPNPAPKLDAVFIFAADKKWHDEDEAYKNSVKTNANVNF
jgi:hypothetical protein